MELKLNRGKITGKNQPSTRAATTRKIVLGAPTTTQVVGGYKKTDTTPTVNASESSTANAGRSGFNGNRNGTATGKSFAQLERKRPSLAQRMVSTLSGAGKQYAASLGSALTGLYSMGAATREKENQQEQAEIERRLRLMEQGWQDYLATGKATEEDRLEYEQALQNQREQLERVKTVQRAQAGTKDASLGAMDQLEQSAQQDIDKAKQNLGGVGKLVVDTGVAGSQMLMDVALGGGAAMLPMAGRVFGGGYQEATRDGASNSQALAYGAGSAAVSVLTEKLANVAAPFKKIYGGGWLDDAITKATGKMNTTAAGRIALSALSEAGEEFLEAAAQPVLQRATYDKNAQLDLSEALYSALVGAALGAFGGGVETVTNLRKTETAPSVTADGGASSPASGEPSPQGASESAAQRAEAQTRQVIHQQEETPSAAVQTQRSLHSAEAQQAIDFLRDELEAGSISKEEYDAAVNTVLETETELKQAGRSGAENIQTFGGMTDGAAENGKVREEPSGGGRQRDAGASTGGEAGILGESAEGARERAAEQQRAARDRQNLANALRLTPVSGAELGLSSGTQARVTRVIPEAHWDEAMHQTARRVQQETGKRVTFVVGAIQTRRRDGSTGRVRGVYSDSGIIVQADNLRYTIDQIADHETFHDKAARTPGLVKSIRERITQEYTQEKLGQVLEEYIKAMRGVIDIPVNATTVQEEAAMLALWEEVCADAYAGMNAFGAQAERFNPTVERVMTEQGVGRSQEIAQATERTTGPPEWIGLPRPGLVERYSISAPEGLSLPTPENVVAESDVKGYTDSNNTRPYGVTEAEQAALMDYKSSESYKINAVLREGMELDDSQKQLVSDLDSALDKFPDHTGKVYRNITFDGFGDQEAFDQFMADIETGFMLFEGYTSTATAEDGYPIEGPFTVHMVIEGKTGKNMEGFGNNFESEVLFKRGMEVSVDRVEYAADGTPTIYMTEDVDNGQAGTGKPHRGDHRGEQNRQSEGDSVPGVPEVRKVDSENQDVQPVPGEDSGGNLLGQAELQRDGGEVTPQRTNTPEWISLPRPERFSVDDSETEQPKQAQPRKWTQERAVAEELERRTAQEYQQQLLRQGGLAALKENDKEIKKLQRRLDKLNGRMPPKKAKQQAAPPRKSLPTQAKQDLRENLLNLFSIPEGQRTELGAVIDHYADLMLKEGGLTQKIRDAFFDRMYSSGVVTVKADPYYQAGRSAVAGGRVYVNEQIKGDVGKDWNDFRKRAFAAGVYLTNDRSHAGVDVWNKELAELLPGMFDADELDGRTVLERIVQVAEEGKDEKMSLADYTAMLAQRERVTLDQQLDGIERQMDWALRTFAEKARLEIRLRDRTGIKLAQMRADHKEAAERRRVDRELRELQQKTLKQLQWLSKNRNRAPEQLRAAFDEVLSDIDLFAVGAADEMKWDKRYGATWRDIAQMYKDAREHDPNFLPSKEMERIISRLDDRKIADMDVDALQTLYRAAVGLRTEFYNRKNVIADTRMFEEVFDKSKSEIENASGGYTGKLRDKVFNLEQLTPMNVLRRMAGWDPDSAWVSMAKQLEKGERDMRAFTVEANRLLEQFLNEHEDWAKRADGQGKDAIWYEVTVPELAEYHMGHKPIFGKSVTVYMTPAQKVHLYLESKNEDNLRHMTGGRTFADKELYSKGERQEALANGRTIRLAPETVRELVKDLTAEELELARLLEGFYNDFAKKRINRVSNTLYGFDKAIGKNYAPIFTNSNYTQSEFGVFDVTAEGVGNLKERQYSKNPSYNLSCFDAFERSVDRTARFVGMAIPARNWQTLLNWRTKNTSMGDILTHKWGEEGKKYIEDLVTELQSRNSTQRDTVSTAADRAFSKYIAAVFGANPSIVLKQLGSIPLASAYLDVKNAPGVGQLRTIDRGLIAKYTQELDYRTMGYSMPETKLLKDNPGLMQSNKFLNFTFGGGAITAMDGWAASTLWPWAENKVRRDFPELEVGTQEQIDEGKSPFYQKVAELFNEAVSHTQSVSDITHQSTIRKSRNSITRAFTMFKSDAAQGYNVLRQKIGEAQYYKKNGADEQTVRNAQRKAGGAFLSILVGYTYAQAITFLIALWKNQGKKYKDEDDELTLESILGEMAVGVAGDLTGLVVGGQELTEIIGSIFTGERWYGIETPGSEQLNNMLEELISAGKGARQFIRDMADVVNQGGDPMEYIRRHGNDYLGGIKDVAATVATYFPGLPVNNLEAYLLGLVRWASPELAAAYEDLLATANKSGLSGLKGDALALRVRHALENRAGDVSAETAKTLAELYEAGYIKAVPTDTPGTLTVGEEDDKEELKLDAYQQQLYDMAWREAISGKLDELVTSETFREAESKSRETMVNRVYEYAREKGRAAVSDRYEMSSTAQKADRVFATGASVADWLELREVGGVDGYLKQLGYEVGATPEQYVQLRENIEAVDDNGSVTQAEAEQAIGQTPELTTDQKAALWQMQNKGWSAKNNPFSPGVGAKVKRAMEEDAASDAPAWISLPKPGE